MPYGEDVEGMCFVLVAFGSHQRRKISSALMNRPSRLESLEAAIASRNQSSLVRPRNAMEALPGSIASTACFIRFAGSGRCSGSSHIANAEANQEALGLAARNPSPASDLGKEISPP